MQYLKHLMKASLLAVLLAACQGKEIVAPQPAPDPIPVDTGVAVLPGVADGDPVTKTIGAAGGTIATTDARISINIPAGALTSETVFTIQPITNTNNAGLGKAFRITPHLALSKPATITFHYEQEDLSNTFAEALGIAYQDNAGKWKAIGGIQLNKEMKSVSVKTTHFSDWSFFEAISLEPADAYIDPGASQQLAVKAYLNAGAKDILAPLTEEGTESYITSGKNDLLPTFIDKWELAGDGQLTANGSHATYKAPAILPAVNPVIVSVKIKLKDGALGILLSRIFVMPEGIAIRIDGGEWNLLGAASGTSSNGMNRVGAMLEDGSLPSCNITWMGAATGRRSWSDKTYFTLQVWNNQIYQSGYQINEASFPSPGSLQVIGVDPAGGYMIGKFHMDRASSQKPVGDKVIYKEHVIDGVFRVKRLI
ncbi:MAG: hypothetical protein J7623_25860 [Chitinophaga sp.]|uniref:hypothetical protein n=1 Tax=Chitinophaga sp. TaxID=1869181 RepID=UPI001B1A5786|nr:hypothetical protein [Chitinophaga sp.]MBO9732093.1 hypothetical protein [Chitinophaga sp.]